MRRGGAGGGRGGGHAGDGVKPEAVPGLSALSTGAGGATEEAGGLCLF